MRLIFHQKRGEQKIRSIPYLDSLLLLFVFYRSGFSLKLFQQQQRPNLHQTDLDSFQSSSCLGEFQITSLSPFKLLHHSPSSPDPQQEHSINKSLMYHVLFSRLGSSTSSSQVQARGRCRVTLLPTPSSPLTLGGHLSWRALTEDRTAKGKMPIKLQK